MHRNHEPHIRRGVDSFGNAGGFAAEQEHIARLEPVIETGEALRQMKGLSG